jgi:hypothetical protein
VFECLLASVCPEDRFRGRGCSLISIHSEVRLLPADATELSVLLRLRDARIAVVIRGGVGSRKKWAAHG